MNKTQYNILLDKFISIQKDFDFVDRFMFGNCSKYDDDEVKRVNKTISNIIKNLDKMRIKSKVMGKPILSTLERVSNHHKKEQDYFKNM